MAGCGLSSAPPCQPDENTCDGDTAHSCEPSDLGPVRLNTKCDPNTEFCDSGRCVQLTR
jgi:hypothetical protein